MFSLKTVTFYCGKILQLIIYSTMWYFMSFDLLSKYKLPLLNFKGSLKENNQFKSLLCRLRNKMGMYSPIK